MKYTETQIQSVLQLLNRIEVKGVDNCKRICIIEQILQNPQREEKNGNCSEEKHPVTGRDQA